MSSSRLVAGRYELLSRLGRGGSSTVWLARDRVDGTPVALKWIRRVDLATARQARGEVATLRLLQVPGVVTLRDEGEARGRPFVVMERVVGDAFPGRPIPCAWEALEAPLLSLLDALARVHALGVVHRDLKPANVLVREGRAVLVDFGIARLDASWRDPAADDASTWGTLAYMAPEAIRGDDDPRSDLFAVGVMAYRALTGRFPFPVRGTVAEVIARRAHAPPPAWGAVALPEAVRDVLTRMLAPRPDGRPSTAQEVAACLRASARRLDDAHLLARDRWDPVSLGSLFVGHERLLHLREDAARLLHARTGGDPRRVAVELDRWVRNGIARRVEGAWAVRRESLDALGFAVAPEVPDAPRPAPSGDAGELAAWLSLVAAPIGPGALAVAVGWGRHRVARGLRSLAAEGRTQRGPGGVVALVPGEATPLRWHPARRRAAHAALAAALPREGEARLRHLLLACASPTEVAAEVRAVAARVAARGELARAEHALREGVRALRAAGREHGDAVAKVFTLWARVALEQWSPAALDRVRYELPAAEGLQGRLAAIERILRAAHATLHWTPQARDVVARVAPCADPELELLRRQVMVAAARRVSAEETRRVLDAMPPPPPGRPEFVRYRVAWEAALAFSEERYDDAARGHVQSARAEPWVSRRHRELLNAASSWLEVGRFARARAVVARVEAEAARLRLPVIEGRAVWLRRTLDWREGRAAEPDPAWVDAACEVDPVVARLMAFHEATLAWHERDATAFAALFARARGIEGAVADRGSFPLLEAMAVDLGVTALDAAAREELIARAAARVPAIALQVAALTAPPGPPDAAEVARALALAATVPRARWSMRLDVLSVDGCLARLGVTAQ